MELKQDERTCQRREIRSSWKAGRHHQKAAAANNILEAMVKFGCGEVVEADQDGRIPTTSTRMKIVVKKEDLKQVLEAIRDCRGGSPHRASAPPQTAVSLEQRLNMMRRRQILRVAGLAARSGRCRKGPWRPVLQSIPEEL